MEFSLTKIGPSPVGRLYRNLRDSEASVQEDAVMYAAALNFVLRFFCETAILLARCFSNEVEIS